MFFYLKDMFKETKKNFVDDQKYLFIYLKKNQFNKKKKLSAGAGTSGSPGDLKQKIEKVY